jgi:hypothetical protein
MFIRGSPTHGVLKMAWLTTRLARLSKMRLAEFQQIIEPYMGRFASHLVEDLLVRRHPKNGTNIDTIFSRIAGSREKQVLSDILEKLQTATTLNSRRGRITIQQVVGSILVCRRSKDR